MKISYLWQATIGYFSTAQRKLDNYASLSNGDECSLISFSNTWLVLGPWQIGTREAAWGSDPIETYGGFHNLTYDPNAVYRSSIANNGTVAWSSLQAKIASEHELHASARLEVDFENVDWAFLQQVYGWAAMQWQGWARGYISIHRDSAAADNFMLFTEGVLEFWINGQHYFGGDFYSFRRAPVLVHLKNGVHTIDVRLIRDVRAMGGIGQPSLDMKITLERVSNTLQNVSDLLISDVVAEKGKLGSPYASLYLFNGGDKSVNVRKLIWHSRFCSFFSHTLLRIAPGQTRPLLWELDCNMTQTVDAKLELVWIYESDDAEKSLVLHPRLQQTTLHEPQKVTFVHPSGIVSYAVLRPPSLEAIRKCSSYRELPVLLAMHGAGLEADDELVKHSLDVLPNLCAWVVFPTGVTAWSGDDWHVWGFADVEAAVSSIKIWMDQVGWHSVGVAIDRWLVTGHSNGGQGTWYALTHKPDNIIAAAPISGYSSIQNYVPYSFWQPADQGRASIVQASLNTYRHEILLANAQGIPIFQQHGGADNNVPAYHSRLLSQRLRDLNIRSQYVEFPGKPHWWDGVMNTEQLAEFFSKELNGFQDHAMHSLNEWTLVTSNPASTGAKNGIDIIHLINAGQLGKVNVRLSSTTSSCIISTSNVRTFKLQRWLSQCNTVVIDEDANIDLGHFSAGQVVATKSHDSKPCWIISNDPESLTNKNHIQLHKQNVGMDGILRTLGTFQIVQHSNTYEATKVALQVSRNLCQYFAADTDLETDYDSAKQASGNIVSIAVGSDFPKADNGFDTVSVSNDRLCIREKSIIHCYSAESGLSAIFLRPLPDNRLELVIWAQQSRNLDIAARLVPTLTGVGQPDFIVLRDSMKDGLENTVALGFYDESWGVSRNTFFA